MANLSELWSKLAGPAVQDKKPAVLSLTLSDLRSVPGYRFGLRQPSLVARIDVKSQGQVPSALGKHLWEQVSACLPERYRSVGGALVDTSLEGLMHTLVRLVGAIQDSVGLPVVDTGLAIRLHSVNQSNDPGVGSSWILVLPSFGAQAAERALRELLQLLHARGDKGFEGIFTSAELGRFEALLDDIARLAPAGTNTHRLMRAALRRQIPMIELPGKVWQFGWGCKARVFKSSLSDATSAIGTSWAKHKVQTNQLLRQAGFPVPEQVEVCDLGMALREAERIGYPVVLKPADLDQGIGVEAGLMSQAELRAAFGRVSKHKRALLLEKHIAGQDLRVNVVNGRFQDAIARFPAGVTGDGVTTVGSLVKEENRDPRRSTRRFADMRPIALDEEAIDLLEAQGLSQTSIPEAGRFVRLRRSSSISTGGHTRGVTAEIHPDNALLCEQAAKLLRLDIAGIDLLIPDRRKSWREGGAAICEVNAQPQMGLTYPKIFDHLFEEFLEGQGRIPIGLVLTDNSETADAIRSELLESTPIKGLHVVLESALRMQSGAYCEVPTLRGALMDPDCTSLVIITNGESFGVKGLPIDRFDFLYIADWRGDEMQLRKPLSHSLPHLASADVFIEENLSPLINGDLVSSSLKVRFGDRKTIALAVGQRLIAAVGTTAVC